MLSLLNGLLLVACGGDRGGEADSVGEIAAFAQEILREHDYVRTNPREYAAKVVKPAMERYTGAKRAAAQELYEELLSVEPMGALDLGVPLMKAAQWFADDHMVSGKVGHVGSDGASVGERIKRNGGAYRGVGENCAYGVAGAQEVLLLLLVDDGVEGRGHRRNILNREYRYLGVGKCTGSGVPYNCVVVIDYGMEE